LALWGFRVLGILSIISMILAMHFQAEKKSIAYRAEIEAAKKIEQTLKQVSHDIRSPLSALTMTIEDAEGIPPAYSKIIKLSVQRINDLANNLLSKNIGQDDQEIKIQDEMLSPIIDSLVSEKRTIFSHQANVKIELDLSESYGIFSSVSASELKRVLSNLINNAVEALNDESGERHGAVNLKLTKSSENMALISIVDNGKGMSKSTLSKLGQEGFTQGKNKSDSGFGLGFFHAKNTIQSFGGNIEVVSNEGKGTTINILLPQVLPPQWFIGQIDLKKDQDVYVLDDDENMLKAWIDRFPVSIKTFRSGELFMNFINNLRSDNFIVLVDLELEGQNYSGVDIIQILKIESKSILVTSHADEKELQDTCTHSNIKLLPKLMASLIPIKADSLS
jgi:nitrogen-specific signal transduction histidine kinase